VGLQGEVKVALLTDFPERFDRLESVIVQGQQGDPLRLRLAHVRHRAPFVYLSFAGLADLDAVRPLHGALLQVPISGRVALPEGRYFHSDLLGLTVQTQQGRILGRISDIIETGSHDVFVVKGEEGEFLIPAHHKFVSEVDLAQKRMLVDPVDNLLDL